MSATIIDNLLSVNDFDKIVEALTGCATIPWHLNNYVSSPESDDNSLIYFTHIFYNDGEVISSYLKTLLMPILDYLQPKALIRIKANLYPNTCDIMSHDPHIDYPFEHKAALFMVNSNNGFTTLHDGTCVESVANRLVLFDSHLPHNSSTCSDEKYRVTINFNYF